MPPTRPLVTERVNRTDRNEESPGVCLGAGHLHIHIKLRSPRSGGLDADTRTIGYYKPSLLVSDRTTASMRSGGGHQTASWKGLLQTTTRTDWRTVLVTLSTLE